MMKKAVFVLLAIVFSVLQITVTWHFKLGWHNYSLALCAVIVISSLDLKTGLISAGVSGFLIDCIIGRSVGLNLLILLLSSLAVSAMSRGMNSKKLPVVLVVTFVITFATEFVQYWLYLAVNGSGNISFALTKIIFPQAFINLIAVIPVYLVIKSLWKKLRMQKERWEY